MPRTWTDPEDAKADALNQIECKEIYFPVGHPLAPLPRGGRIVQVKWADNQPEDFTVTEKMCFTEQENGTFSRSKTVMKL